MLIVFEMTAFIYDYIVEIKIQRYKGFLSYKFGKFSFMDKEKIIMTVIELNK